MTTNKEKTEYRKKLREMTDDKLRAECNQYIWLSAFAGNNLRSKYHWMCDYAYDECDFRGKVHIYQEEHRRLSKG